MPGSTNTWFPNRGAVMLCWAAMSLMAGPAGPAVAGAAVAGTALAAVAMTSPAAAIAAVITFRRFNASYSLRCANGHIRQAYRPPGVHARISSGNARTLADRMILEVARRR